MALEAYRSGSRVVIKGASWDFKGVPASQYAPEFEKNPMKARRDYGAEPPDVAGGIWPNPDIVEMNGYDIEEPPVRQPGVFRSDFVGDPRNTYYCHFDLSLTGDQCGFAMTHYDQQNMLVEVDAVFQMQVSKDLPLRFAMVERFIDHLMSADFNIVWVGFDGFQSAHIIENMRNRGVRSEVYSVDRTPEAYDTLVSLIVNKKIHYYKDPTLVRELRTLKFDGKKYDHPPRSSKDVADALAGATVVCLKESASVSFTNDDLVQAFVLPPLAAEFDFDDESMEFKWKRPGVLDPYAVHSVYVDTDDDSLIIVHGYERDSMFFVDYAEVFENSDSYDVPLIMRLRTEFRAAFVSTSTRVPYRIIDALRSANVRIVSSDGTPFDRARNKDMRVPRARTKEQVEVFIAHVKQRQIQLVNDARLFRSIAELSIENFQNKPMARAVADWLHYMLQNSRRNIRRGPSPVLMGVGAGSQVPALPVTGPSGKKRGAGPRLL